MSSLTNRIVEVLGGCANGLTSKELANRLGITRGDLSSPLSKLAAYGIIKKSKGQIAPGVRAIVTYRAKSTWQSDSHNLGILR